MNTIYSDPRSKLTIKNISCLMFININVLLLLYENPQHMLKVVSSSNRSADDNRLKKVEPVGESIEKNHYWIFYNYKLYY